MIYIIIIRLIKCYYKININKNAWEQLLGYFNLTL